MEPVKVESYSDFVNTFGDTVPGFGGGDIYRHGNLQSPMYGTYAAKAFLNSNVAPLTYIRLLGQQTSLGSTAGGDAAAGWKTSGSAPTTGGAVSPTSNAGAFGMFIFPQTTTTEATASINFKDIKAIGSVSGSTYTIISSDGTSKTYIAVSGTFTAGVTDGSSGFFKFSVVKDASDGARSYYAMTQLSAAIHAVHNGAVSGAKIRVNIATTGSTPILTLEQNGLDGADGNRQINAKQC